MEPLFTEVAEYLGRDVAVLRATAAMLVLLAAGSLVRTGVYLAGRREGGIERFRSLGTWWIIAGLIALMVALGEGALLLLMVAASCLALYEYLFHVQPSPPAPWLTATAYALIVVQYTAIGWGAADLALAILPTLGAILLLTIILATAPVGRYAAKAGPLVLGMLLVIYLLSFVAMPVARLPAGVEAATDPLAPALVLLWLTMTHDIASALVGRAIGRRRVLPTISPRKTWAGVIGGSIVAAGLGGLLADVLLGKGWLIGVGAGVVVAAGAFAGDATMSAIKRDQGLDDSGRLLPGQGGMLDRIDSLSFAAPLLFFYLHLL